MKKLKYAQITMAAFVLSVAGAQLGFAKTTPSDAKSACKNVVMDVQDESATSCNSLQGVARSACFAIKPTVKREAPAKSVE